MARIWSFVVLSWFLVTLSQGLEFSLDEFGSTYIFYPNSDKYFIGAAGFCGVKGHRLFTPRSDREAKAVFDRLPSGITQIWVGITSSRSTGYYNLEGEYMDNINWSDKTKQAKKDFVKMFRDGTYEDVDNGNSLDFICRKKVERTITPEEEQDLKRKFVAKGYVYWNNYKAAYKYYASEFHTRGNIKCMSENASLFVPESKEEARDIFTLVPYGEDKLWIGSTKVFNGYFETYDGIVLDKLYVNWGEGQPENCNACNDASINRDGTYEASRLNNKKPYVCKKKFPEVTPEENENDYSYGAYGRPTPELGSMYNFNPAREYYFMDALVYCATIGHNLFFPKTPDDVRWVFERLPNYVNDIWIGVSSYQMNDFYTLTGEIFKNDDRNWNYKTNKKSFVSVTRNGIYNDVDNHVKLRFVCRKQEDTIANSNSRAVRRFFSRKGYVFWDEYNSMYKYHSSESSFTAALKCMLENATLLIPESSQEITDVFDLVPLRQRQIWIAAKKAQNGDFLMYNGKSIGDTFPYAKWDVEQPSHCELCNFVVMNRQGTYETVSWLEDKPFICKKKLS